jgi:ribonuclease HI
MYFNSSYAYEFAWEGVLIVSPSNEQLKYDMQMWFDKGFSTNYTAEYEGMLAGLRASASLSIRQIVVCGDSQLLVNQVNQEYACHRMMAYVDDVRRR